MTDNKPVIPLTKDKMKKLKSILLFVSGIISCAVQAQELDVNLQLRPRFEYRNGYKTLLPEGQKGTSQIAQRSRLNFDYKQDEFKIKLTLQNVRTWGDVPTNTTADKNGIALFEAWAEYNFNEKWSMRLGRQVLSYDNQRIMGEIDWLQQGQSHDAVLVTFHPENQQLDLGAAYNSTAENTIQTPYTVASYKAMQYAWYHNKINNIGASLLILNTGYEYANTAAKLLVDYKQTFGTYLTYKTKKIDSDLGLYGQTGKSTDKKISAWYAGANFGYFITTAFKVSLGYEFLSGKDMNNGSTVIKSFSPIFGTNHAFNGYMDYFYVGNHQNSVGLQDAFVKLNYSVNKWQFALIPHVFSAPNKVITTANETLDSYLGTEVDFTTTFKFKKDITLTGGYSQMFGSKTLEFLKAGDAGHTNNWAWVMISVNPKIFTFTPK
ncbi:MAG: alginate export family protein [Flavobacterium sp.]